MFKIGLVILALIGLATTTTHVYANVGMGMGNGPTYAQPPTESQAGSNYNSGSQASSNYNSDSESSNSGDYGTPEYQHGSDQQYWRYEETHPGNAYQEWHHYHYYHHYQNFWHHFFPRHNQNNNDYGMYDSRHKCPLPHEYHGE
jgi:hypothetical protein